MSNLVCVKRSDSFIFVSIVCVKHTDSFISILLHNIKVVLCLNLQQAKFWTLINLMNNIVIVLVCVKCSKLITSEENTISIQQLPLCPPLFFVFSSEVLSSSIKICFDGVVFQDAVIMLYLCCIFTSQGISQCFTAVKLVKTS